MTPHQAAPGGSRQSGISRSGAHTPRQWPVEGACMDAALDAAPRDYQPENVPFIGVRHAPVWLDRLEGALIVTGIVAWVWLGIAAIGWATAAVAGWWS